MSNGIQLYLIMVSAFFQAYYIYFVMTALLRNEIRSKFIRISGSISLIGIIPTFFFTIYLILSYGSHH